MEQTPQERREALERHILLAMTLAQSCDFAEELEERMCRQCIQRRHANNMIRRLEERRLITVDPYVEGGRMTITPAGFARLGI